MNDPKCAACGESRSAHVVTTQGPFTCRRVAQGEGLYEYTGTWSAGLGCSNPSTPSTPSCASWTRREWC